MKPILEISHISKKFKINHEQQPYLSLRDSLSSIFKSRSSTQDFLALQDITFNVQQGDTIGIIGKNGAGKSTLLKILSRITPPTSGKIICRGRIASLLEVGTGFHPELSGRENVFMNGSILGMRKAEILKNFDAIIDFAGIDKFVDTPLKHYSSGMQLRLAFAVAAFLENEILIIDEVLAVGDAEFQKKCMGKMGDISQTGRTILFVSHNMAAVKHLCKKGLHLSKGMVHLEGDINTVIDSYNSKTLTDASDFIEYDEATNINEFVFVKSIKIKDTDQNNSNVFIAGQRFIIEVKIKALQKLKNTVIGIGFTSNEGAPIRTTWIKPTDFEIGHHCIEFIEDTVMYGKGTINLSVGIATNEINIAHFPDCINVVFEENLDKEIALRSDCGYILNQMNYKIVHEKNN